MTSTTTLDAQGQLLLALLVARLPSVRPANPRTFIGYKQAHDLLGLPQMREKFGDSLKAQGLLSLAEWTYKTGKPAITGLVVDRESLMPGQGYFQLFGRQQEDFTWWREEIEKSKSFDWSPFLPQVTAPQPPLAVDIDAPPDRAEVTTYRIIRDTLLARKVKQLHNYQCQLCDHTIVLPDGSRYAEAHHVQPLGTPHNGPDVLENIVCVCPNHHAELDYGARSLNHVDLHSVEGHSVGSRYLSYHNTNVHKEPSTPATNGTA
ncbi:hypothetical protein C4J95_4380 [Pseudomonas orientalis]|uniref:HNH endonuclease n=1 Tax=Pseudomonas orientalis TaxID=76758 RepID=UPI000F55A623|nr:HNH endonuclease [Pseudomonas orientalis]AZF01811.1 hypothetical protein C4J95_4380 [Pseudomonas orientalis]